MKTDGPSQVSAAGKGLLFRTRIKATTCHVVTGARARWGRKGTLPQKMKVDVTECTCATQNGGGCFQTPRPPQKQARRQWEQSAPQEPAQCHKRDTCHTKWRSMSPSATPATQNGGRCFQMPSLPHKQPRRQRNKRATRASPRPNVPRLQRQVPHLTYRTEVYVFQLPHKQPQRQREPSAPQEAAQCHKCHTCHTKWRSM
jgi:hypothetical protein